MAGFSPVEAVDGRSLTMTMMVEKGVKVSFREGWVEEARKATLLWVVLAEGVVLMVVVGEAVVAVEGTLEEAVVWVLVTPVEEGEGLTTLVKIRKMNVVTP